MDKRTPQFGLRKEDFGEPQRPHNGTIFPYVQPIFPYELRHSTRPEDLERRRAAIETSMERITAGIARTHDPAVLERRLRPSNAYNTAWTFLQGSGDRPAAKIRPWGNPDWVMEDLRRIRADLERRRDLEGSRDDEDAAIEDEDDQAPLRYPTRAIPLQQALEIATHGRGLGNRMRAPSPEKPRPWYLDSFAQPENADLRRDHRQAEVVQQRKTLSAITHASKLLKAERQLQRDPMNEEYMTEVQELRMTQMAMERHAYQAEEIVLEVRKKLERRIAAGGSGVLATKPRPPVSTEVVAEIDMRACEEERAEREVYWMGRIIQRHFLRGRIRDALAMARRTQKESALRRTLKAKAEAPREGASSTGEEAHSDKTATPFNPARSASDTAASPENASPTTAFVKSARSKFSWSFGARTKAMFGKSQRNDASTLSGTTLVASGSDERAAVGEYMMSGALTKPDEEGEEDVLENSDDEATVVPSSPSPRDVC